MTVYILAQLSFKDRAAYDRYQARFMGVFKKFGGRVLAADERPEVLEGKWDRAKVVLLSFPDKETAYRFMNAPEYQEIAKDRKAGADAISLLVHGFPTRADSAAA
jgi:uncharacterized protein (DUF1330 family)